MEHFHTWTDNQREQEMLWQHSFTAAGMARVIAQWRPWINNEEAYVLGLLHDLGRMVLMVHFPEDYQEIRKIAQDQKISYCLAEEQYGMPHTQIAKWLSIKWHLPPVYQRVLEYHHDPLNAPESQKEVKMIFLADVLAHSETCPGVPNDAMTMGCCANLYISADEWQSLYERSGAIRNEATNLWNILK